MLAIFAIVPACAREINDTRVTEAVSRSIAALQRSQDQWKIPCMSCHHHGVPLVLYQSARLHGVKVNEESVRAFSVKTFRMLSGYEMALQMPLDAFGIGYGLLAIENAGINAGITAEILARRFQHSQHSDGHWSANDVRPPHSHSTFAATVLAVRAMDRHLPMSQAAGREEQFVRARQWLRRQTPVSTEDSTFRLLGLTWAHAGEADRNYAATDLLRRQRPDGGWGQMPDLESDAYSTGEALVALARSGAVATTDETYRRGVRFLL